MSPPILSRGSRQLLLTLPPSLRVALYQQASLSRSFSVTTSRPATNASITPPEVTAGITRVTETGADGALEHITAIPLGLLDVIHSTGLPWWAVLPASAMLVRGGFVYYLITKRLRQHAQIQSTLVPLVSARALMLSRTPRVQADIQAWAPFQRQGALWSKFKCTEQAAGELGKQFGAPRPYRSWRPYASFGVLIVMTEAIRMKCGTRHGFLSAFLSPFQWCWQQIPWPSRPASSAAHIEDENNLDWASPIDLNILDVKGTSSTIPSSVSSQTYTSDIVAAARESTSDPAVLSALSKLDGTAAIPHAVPTYAQHMDPTMHTEGFLWITDLTIVDPYQIFPVLAAVMVTLQIAIKPRRHQSESLQSPANRHAQTVLRLTPEVERWFKGLPLGRRQSIVDRAQVAQQWKSTVEEASPDLQIAALTAVSYDSSGVKAFTRTFMEEMFSWRTKFAVVVGSLSYSLVFLHMPAGILLYFLSSISVGWVQAGWLNYRVPIVPAILPCRRSLRFKTRGIIEHNLR